MSDLDAIQRAAHAKINLTLAILGRRADGYHDIESWMARISLCDDLSFQKADAFSLTISGVHADIPADERNLVARAHAAISSHTGRALPTRISLHKRIPTGAGLGGGSSDAASTLLALNELWNLRLSTETLIPIAASIGSDVPYFLIDSQAIVRGRGELVSAIDGWRGWAVLITPPFGVSTVSVYTQYAGQPGARPVRERAWELPIDGAVELCSMLFNDLQPAAFAVEPRLGELHGLIGSIEQRTVLMSGSGSTLYALFDERPQAESWLARAARVVGERANLLAVQIL